MTTPCGGRRLTFVHLLPAPAVFPLAARSGGSNVTHTESFRERENLLPTTVFVAFRASLRCFVYSTAAECRFDKAAVIVCHDTARRYGLNGREDAAAAALPRAVAPPHHKTLRGSHIHCEERCCGCTIH